MSSPKQYNDDSIGDGGRGNRDQHAAIRIYAPRLIACRHHNRYVGRAGKLHDRNPGTVYQSIVRVVHRPSLGTLHPTGLPGGHRRRPPICSGLYDPDAVVRPVPGTLHSTGHMRLSPRHPGTFCALQLADPDPRALHEFPRPSRPHPIPRHPVLLGSPSTRPSAPATKTTTDKT
ncbi:hypothetical protein J3B02_003760 [Coemansia erecta]|nr:hypothetical protein J3B02_003760 [Coemansia erecta]